jgi:hypothetical protein
VVRFTGVTEERIEALNARLANAEGPPPGVESSGVQFLVDRAQETAVVIQDYPSAEAMEEAAKVLSEMDSSETPGIRASVDSCEVVGEIRA